MITFVGNKGSYGLLDTVAISCATTDAAPSSGIKVDPCKGFSISGPGWSFQPGTNTLPSPGLVATDNAGNSSAPATTSFTVAVSGATLGSLTVQFVQSSATYKAAPALEKLIVTSLAAVVSQFVVAIVPHLSASAQATLIADYKAGMKTLVSDGWLTSAQGATLDTLVTSL